MTPIASGNKSLQSVIEILADGVPKELEELITLGRPLKRPALVVHAHVDHPGAASGPIEAISGRLERLRGAAPGFHSVTCCIIRALLDTEVLRTELRSHL